MKTATKISFSIAALAIAVGITACGGGGGGGGSSNEATIEGSLVSASAATAREGAMAGVQVSALGSTATTDELGSFTLTADGQSFAGGEVQFSFVGNGVDTTTILDGVQGGPGAVTIATFEVTSSGRVSGEATDLDGNVLGSTPGGNLDCSQVSTFVDGGQGALWKPVSESHGTPVTLMPPNYENASVAIFNNAGEQVDTPLRRNCCEHNGGRDHSYWTRTGGDLASTGLPLTVRYAFPDGFVDCRVVENPFQRYD